LAKLGLSVEAEQALKRASELDPACVQAWVNLGGVKLARWDFQGCIEANRKALEVNPELVEAHFNQGLGHLYAGETDGMIECFRRVIDLDHMNSGGHYYLAVAHLEKGEAEGARQSLARAVSLGYSPDPDFIKALEKMEPPPKPSEEPLHVIELGADVEE
jgi:tetratricopeptide (TPR) repeat protein